MRNGASVLQEEFCDFIAVDPDLIGSVLLHGIEDELDPEMQVRCVDVVDVFLGAVAGHAETETPFHTLDEMERSMVKRAIDQCEGNLSQAAAMLGITRQTLYNKMKRYGL